ncbi:DNA-binding protein [uncultured Marinobacter sp.]|uniref:DNA-binding protein n=3 Tax=Gammaproteobacteria TaxID=1236 RepID=UPI0030D887B4|tara:strand:- start:18454 stop:19041 length:588 start_codon:yes stop_codon:yes gene_type:complete
MRPADHTDQEIIEAGKRLQDQDRKVTGYGLRNELGGGDQKRLLAVWKNFTAQDVVESIPDTELPAELEESLNSASQTLLNHLRSMAVQIHQAATKVAERQVAEITRQYKELEEQTDAELKDAAIIIEKRESEIVDLKYRLAITEEKLDSARRDAEQHEKEAFRLQTKLGEMKGVESLIARLEALEEKAANDKLGV